MSDIDADGPLEPPGGQDDEPPDLLLAVIVTLRVLRDVVPKLDAYDADHPDADAADLLLRITALRSVLGRVRGELETASP